MSASDSAFNAAVDAGALSLVTNLTEDASDVLLQLNALELLEQVLLEPTFNLVHYPQRKPKILDDRGKGSIVCSQQKAGAMLRGWCPHARRLP